MTYARHNCRAYFIGKHYSEPFWHGLDIGFAIRMVTSPWLLFLAMLFHG